MISTEKLRTLLCQMATSTTPPWNLAPKWYFAFGKENGAEETIWCESEVWERLNEMPIYSGSCNFTDFSWFPNQNNAKIMFRFFPFVQVCMLLGAGAFNGAKINFFVFTFHSLACDARFFSVNREVLSYPESLVYAAKYWNSFISKPREYSAWMAEEMVRKNW